MKTPKITPLVLALSVPIIMIILIAVSIYVPRLWVKPGYDFVYNSNGPAYYGYGSFTVEGETLQKLAPSPEYLGSTPASALPTNPPEKLYVYHVETAVSEEISFEDAQKLRLSDKKTSPDGFQVEEPSYSPSMLFTGGRDYYSRYLVGKGVSKKLELEQRDNYTPAGFIGWVLK